MIVRETLPVVDAIAARIEERGISRRQASRELEVAPQTVPNWLKGNHVPPLNADTQQALSRFLGVSPRRVVELFQLDLSDEVDHPSEALDSADHTGP